VTAYSVFVVVVLLLSACLDQVSYYVAQFVAAVLNC
jgi:hypothetical protein